ncbi:DUF1761 domain-containing protein [Devosia sp.]|uniref:DUF1761 domain-containing protein n=1 Tax=Devosia sp. TaxID=1871048 RepID=UPI003A92EF3A
MDFTFNWLGIVIAVVASWGTGALWYMVLSSQWLAAIGKTRDQINPKDPTPFIFGFAVQIVMAIVLAAIMPGIMGERSALHGLLTGLLIWFGFVITAMILNHRYEGAPWSRTAIDGGYLLLVLCLQGLIIGVFG